MKCLSEDVKYNRDLFDKSFLSSEGMEGWTSRLSNYKLIWLTTRSNAQIQTDTGSVNQFPSFQSNLEDPSFFVEGQLYQHLREIFQDSKGDLWLSKNI